MKKFLEIVYIFYILSREHKEKLGVSELVFMHRQSYVCLLQML